MATEEIDTIQWILHWSYRLANLLSMLCAVCIAMESWSDQKVGKSSPVSRLLLTLNVG